MRRVPLPSSPHIEYGTRQLCFWLSFRPLHIADFMTLFRGICMMLLCLLAVNPLLSAKAKPAGFSAPDPDYISALAAANRFLHAWQTQDHEIGVLMLTDAAKHRIAEDGLQKFLSPRATAQQAFEINRGKKLKVGRYVFPVVLFQANSGSPRKPQHPRYSQIVVIRTGKDDWAIDKLP